MNYVDAGYVVVLGALFLYAVGLGVRVRAARKRLGDGSRAAAAVSSGAPNDRR